VRLLILGASGACGQWLTRIAVSRGHDVSALIRDGRHVETPGVRHVVQGEVTQPGVLDRAVPGHDAVLCALGIRRASRNPWSPLLSPSDFAEGMIQRLIPAMQRSGVRRLLVISAAGVGDSAAQLTWPVQQLLSLGNVAVAYRDLAAMELHLPVSGLDWLLIRPVALVNGAVRGAAREVSRFALSSTIRRADVAQWMVERVEQQGEFTRRYVTLGT
jgi:putative NADH-flavin reductase